MKSARTELIVQRSNYVFANWWKGLLFTRGWVSTNFKKK